MNTRILMITSALFLGIIGVILTFLPQETAFYFDLEENVITVLFLKLLSALYLGFAILNWIAKGNLIGGIYSRPVAIGNFMHFFVSAIALLKVLFNIETHFEIILVLTICYSIFAILFGYIFITTPGKVSSEK